MAIIKYNLVIKDPNNLIGSGHNPNPDPMELIRLSLGEHYEFKWSMDFNSISETEYDNEWEE